jgi:hypothetical protein
MNRSYTKRGISAWLLLVASLAHARAEAADVLVVCPPAFRAALAPWERYRESQGYKLLVIEPAPSSKELSEAIRRAAEQNSLRFIVLVGDVRHARDDASFVPTCYAKAQVNIRWGSEPTIATDEPYCECGEDHVPSVAIGRIPVHTPDELSIVVRKIIAYEQNADEGTWHRRINLVAGVGGFGPMTDALIEGAGRSVIQQIVPASYEVAPLFAGSTKPGAPSPDQFTDRVCSQLNEGSLAWIYLGHGLPNQLDSIRTSQGERPILSVSDVPQLHGGTNSPFAVLVACYTGAIDAPRGCLAESLLLHDGGPVAVVAATRVTMPYGNAVFGCELLRACFADRPATLGELWNLAQRHTLADSPDDSLRKSLDALASGLSPVPVDLAAERREHVLMYQLYGDPLLRLQYPGEMQFAKIQQDGDQSLTIEGNSSVAGQCTIEFVANEPGGPNTTVLTTATETIQSGAFHIKVAMPSDACASFTARGFVAGDHEFAMGSMSFTLKRASLPMVSRGPQDDLSR